MKPILLADNSTQVGNMYQPKIKVSDKYVYYSSLLMLLIVEVNEMSNKKSGIKDSRSLFREMFAREKRSCTGFGLYKKSRRIVQFRLQRSILCY